MEQQPIREFGGQTYTIDEGAAIVKELDDRTRYAETDYNSIQLLGEKLRAVEGKILQIDNQPFKRKKGYGNSGVETQKGDLAQNGFIVVEGDILKTDLICVDATKDLTTMADGGWERVGNTYKVGNAP